MFTDRDMILRIRQMKTDGHSIASIKQLLPGAPSINIIQRVLNDNDCENKYDAIRIRKARLVTCDKCRGSFTPSHNEAGGRLDFAQATSIRCLYINGAMTPPQLKKHFGVCRMTIVGILQNTTRVDSSYLPITHEQFTERRSAFLRSIA